MDTISIKAPAKLNLFLEITERLNNGYHLLQSVMQSVTLYDELTVSKSEADFFYCNKPELQNGDNLVIKAANAFFRAFGERFSLDIKLIKNIPIAAGLAGGSSDCAAMLVALNRLSGEPFTLKKLCEIGTALGADVPFCLQRGLKFAEGIGEALSPLPPLPECFFVVSVGDEKILTREAFARIDASEERTKRDAGEITEAIKSGSLTRVASSLYNAFENYTRDISRIKMIMSENGALSTLMSGSGPSVFGLYDASESADAAENALRKAGYHAFYCKPEINS